MCSTNLYYISMVEINKIRHLYKVLGISYSKYSQTFWTKFFCFYLFSIYLLTLYNNSVGHAILNVSIYKNILSCIVNALKQTNHVSFDCSIFDFLSIFILLYRFIYYSVFIILCCYCRCSLYEREFRKILGLPFE